MGKQKVNRNWRKNKNKNRKKFIRRYKILKIVKATVLNIQYKQQRSNKIAYNILKKEIKGRSETINLSVM